MSRYPLADVSTAAVEQLVYIGIFAAVAIVGLFLVMAVFAIQRATEQTVAELMVFRKMVYDLWVASEARAAPPAAVPPAPPTAVIKRP